MKEENPKAWWKEEVIKRLSGARSHSRALCNHIHAIGAEELFPQELANAINEAFLEPMDQYRLFLPLAQILLEEDSAHVLVVSELRIARLIAKLNLSKAYGPDGLPDWLLREYSDLLAYPVCSIINALLQEERLPTIWK